MRMTFRVITLIAILVSVESAAATFTVGEVNAEAGDTAVSVPLSLVNAPSDSIAGLQADISFDSGVLTLKTISAGPSADAADKDASFSILSSGKARLIVAGLNQNAIPDGVVVYAVFDLSVEARAGTEAVTLSDVLAADPVGVSVPISAVSGSIIISAEDNGDSDTGGCAAGRLSSAGPRDGLAGDVLLLVAVVFALCLSVHHAMVKRRARR